MSRSTVTIERDGDELTLDVEYTAHAASRGYRDSYGVPEEPDEPACIEIDDWTPNVDLTTAEIADVEQAILDDLEARFGT